MHFFNPAPLHAAGRGRVRARDRRPSVAATAYATAAAWGKSPVHAPSTPGFIVNRCARPFYGEALRLLGERRADPATLDAVMREAGGFRMGPFELMDLIGLDVNCAVTRARVGRVLPRSALRAVGDPAGAGRGGPPRTQVRTRLLRSFGGTPRGPRRGDEPEAARPAAVTVHGELGVAAPIAERIAAAGIAVERVRADSRFPAGAARVAGDGGGAWLALTDGRTATERAVAAGVANVVVFDLAFDYATATRLARRARRHVRRRRARGRRRRAAGGAARRLAVSTMLPASP